jgi:hypothetical protein
VSRIDTWAEEVIKEEPLPVPSPVIERSAAPTPCPVDPTTKLVESFIQAHGRLPNVMNDIYQPKNPGYRGPRPDSRTSSKIAKSSRRLFAKSGSVFMVYAHADRKSSIILEAQPGDQIKYIKHVSGVTHTGLNLRTHLQGQFQESILEPPAQQESHSSYTGMGRGRTLTVSTVSNSLDKVEATNAAEWERESDVSRPTTASVARPRLGFGIAGSRFASIPSPEPKTAQLSSAFTQAEIRKIIREEVSAPDDLVNLLLTSCAAGPVS